MIKIKNKYHKSFFSIILRSSSSILNISIIWIASWLIGKEKVGNITYHYSFLLAISCFFRAGWEQSIVGRNEKNKIFINNIIFSSLLFLGYTYLFKGTPIFIIQDFNLDIYFALTIFFINFCSNLECLLRLTDHPNKTYFFALNASMISFLISILIFNHIIKIILLQSILTSIILAFALFNATKKIQITSNFIHPKVAIKYFPLSLHSFINQYFLQFSLGLYGFLNDIPAALTIQKAAGLITWPINYSIFSKGHSIKTERLFFKEKKELSIVFILMITSLVFITTFLFYVKKSLIISSWILLLGYFFFSLKGDLLFKKIYNEKVIFIFVLQFCIFAMMLIPNFINASLGHTFIFFLNSLYLILISINIPIWKKNAK
jgi:hypothetical protein